MSEFKNGDMVLVSDSGVPGDWVVRKYIGKNPNGIYLCKPKVCHGHCGWNYCKPIPKKTYRPFKDVFEVPVNAWFRGKSNKAVSKIVGVQDDGSIDFPSIKNANDFQDILDNYEMSTDGITWVPAGVEE